MRKKFLNTVTTIFAINATFAPLQNALLGAPGDINTWTGSFNTDITNSNNWDSGNTPQSGEEAFFDNTAANFTPTLSAASTSPLFNCDLVFIDTTLLAPSQYSFFITDNTSFELKGSFFDPSGVQVSSRARGGGGVPVFPVQNFYIDNGGTMEFDRQTQADVGYSTADFGLPPFIVYNLGSLGTAGFMKFNGGSRGGAAGYNLHNASTITFTVNSNAILGQFNLDTNSFLHFTETASSGGAIITALNSAVLYDAGSSSFFSTINLNNSALNYTQAANVEAVTVTAINGSTITIQDNVQTSAHANFNLTDSTLTYKGTADGGQSTITANNSAVSFQGSSRLSSLATIFLNNNSSVEFKDLSDAGTAVIVADDSTITFGNFDNATPFPNSDRATVVLNNNSEVTFNNFSTLLSLVVSDAGSIINFNNFQSSPMIFGPTSLIGNGIVNINPFGPSAFGPVTFISTVNNYVSGTVFRGTLMGDALNITGNMTNFGEIVFNQIAPQVFHGTISGPGTVVIQGGTSMTLANSNFIQASNIQLIDSTYLQTTPNLLQGNIFVEAGSVLDFEVPAHTTQTFSFLISGNSLPDQEEVAINKAGGEGTIILSNPNNSYTGETVVYNGTLQINDVVGVPGVVDLRINSNLVFNQTVDATFNGTIEGLGNVSKIGPAKLILPANRQHSMLLFDLLQGELHLDGSVIAPTFVTRSGTTLSGGGSITGDLEVFGTLAPGNSQTVLTVFGNLEFKPDSQYIIQVDAAGNSSRVDAKLPTADRDLDQGNIEIEGNAVAIELVDSVIDPAKKYTILSAETLLTGRFAVTSINNPFGNVIITYDSQHAYLQIGNAVLDMGRTFNQSQVAIQLDKAKLNDPEVNALTLQLLQLPADEAQRALSQMSAQQYAQISVTAEAVNQHFIRRLYDPLRRTISSDPCCYNNYSCEQIYDTWMDVSYDHSVYKGNSDARGFNIKGYEISLGVQTSFYRNWTAGLAGFYEMDRLDFNLGGSGKNNTGLGALYALYRPQSYYVLADLVLGYSNQKVRRPIDVGTTHYSRKGNPNVFQSALYSEAGVDLDSFYLLGFQPCSHLYSIQPFLGLEIDYVHVDKFHESHSEFLAVDVDSKSQTAASSRLGVHFTTRQSCYYSISLDIAWQCRLSSLKNQFRESFTTFGDEFNIKGIPLHRNSGDGTIYVSTDLARGWSVYAEVGGQVWQNASSYNLLLGVQGSW